MDARLLGARRIRELFERHGIRPHKELGQNFVVDPNSIRKVMGVAALGRDDVVLEIGAGAGSLTLGLAAAARKVIAVEFDTRLVPALEESLADIENVAIVQSDAMKLDYEGVEANALVANLPYNIAVPLVITVLARAERITALTVMTQREVGERLAARAGDDAFGQVSVLVAYWAAASVATRISRNAFYPVPGVDSVVVRMDRRAPPDVSYEDLSRVVKAAFGQRRKTLRNTLGPVAGSTTEAQRALRLAGVDEGARPETVELEGWAAITSALAESSTPRAIS